MYPEKYPDLPMESRGHGNEQAYLFENCKLHLSQLPGHSREINFAMGSFTSEPDATHGFVGVNAYVCNAIIILDSTGVSDTDILHLYSVHCKFQFEVEKVPSRDTQRVLVAALENPAPGSLGVTLN